MTENLIRQLRAYAEKDEYVVTRNLLIRAADALEAQEDNRATLWAKMLADSQNFLDAERYRWLRDGSWDVPQDVIAPAVVLCDGKMSTHVWLTGEHVDKAVDSWMSKEFKRKETKSE
jgi:hypothetical protein